jgi:predicted DNA binding protein
MAKATGDNYRPMEEIAEQFGISRSSAYRYLDKEPKVVQKTSDTL